MKKIKKFFAILLILAIGIAVINSQTDFFLNFGSYVPYLKEIVRRLRSRFRHCPNGFRG